MASAKYLGYVGGAAVAVGIGAALATAGQGTAHAETDSKSASQDSKGPERKTDTVRKALKADRADNADLADKATKKDPAAKLEKKLSKIASDLSAAVKTAPKPKFDAADAVQRLQKQFKADVEQAPAKIQAKIQAGIEIETAEVTVRVNDLATKASEAAASLTKLAAITRADNLAPADLDGVRAAISLVAATPTPPPWELNPLRPMPPEPAPVDMPAALWDLEKVLVNNSPGLLQPWVREGVELGYRVSQFIPWVNAIVPVINIAGDLPVAFAGNKEATQRIVNNLILTLAPASILYYGYDEVADLLNLEVPAQNLKQVFFATVWNIDIFNLLHKPGQSGIPLSPASPDWWCTTTSCDVPSGVASESKVSQVRAVSITSTDALGSDPFRADDPWPTGLPTQILGIEQTTVALLNGTPLAALSPYYREGYEAVYRASQLVPWANVPIPLTAILASITAGNNGVAQVAINQLLLTTPPVSLLYYGFDELADLLNIEDAAAAQKNAFYATVWDTVDPNELLHTLGQSGLTI